MQECSDGLINDRHYNNRYAEMLFEQIKRDHTDYKRLLEKMENGTIGMEDKQELDRIRSYLKKELRVLKGLKSGIEGVLYGEIKEIENDFKS